ncbi:hypothetical protein D3C84_894090 [compost metagenome]
MSVTSYLYDPVRVVTSPGANALDPFSPPSGFSGSAGDYRLLLVSRYRVPASRRYIMAHAKALQDGHNIIFEGPYIMEAADILEKIVASDRMQETKRAG